MGLGFLHFPQPRFSPTVQALEVAMEALVLSRQRRNGAKNMAEVEVDSVAGWVLTWESSLNMEETEDGKGETWFFLLII